MNENPKNSPVKKSDESIGERKEFRLTSFSIDNRISVLVLIFLIAVMGIQSYMTIPKEAQPDITIPNVIVITTYPGVSPVDMEALITRKLEEELSGISDIKQMTSTTAEGYSSINVEFNTDVNIDEALQKVREKVDLAKPELPAEAEDPMIEEINVSEFPIMQVNVSGTYGLEELKVVAEDLQERLETIPQVLEVDLAGGLEKEVQVDVDLQMMKYYGVSFGDIIVAIQNENVTIPAGTVDVGNRKFLMRVPGEYDDPGPIEDIIIDAPNDRPIYIRDVATVTFGEKERESYAYLDSAPVITLSVKKRTGTNIIETSQAVQQIIARERPSMPPSTEIRVTSDMSEDIEMMVSSLENNIISGLLLVIGVLFFFLGVRNASFVGISIPLSMFMSFVILQFAGITMNMIVLFSLILALGMLVDNAIVVVENIFRYLEEGFGNFEAAKKGTGEVAMPIIAGTTTTLAAFLPIAFWPGIVGDFMSYLPITLIITLSSSLFVGLVINPVLCAVFMKLETTDTGTKAALTSSGKKVLYSVGLVLLILLSLGNPVFWIMFAVISILLVISYRLLLKPVSIWWQKEGLNQVLTRYKSTLKWSLKHRFTVLGLTLLLLISSVVVFALYNHGIEFFPEDIPPSRVYAQIETPPGTNVEFTRQIAEELERRARSIDNFGDVETMVTTAGAPISSGMDFGGGNTTNRGTIVLNFVDYNQREGSTFESIEELREILPVDLAGAEITVERQQDGPPTGKPINLEIVGQDLEGLQGISEEILRILENDPIYGKLDGLETDLPEARPEMRITVDREMASIFGVNTNDVGNTIRQAINGVEASQYRDGNDEYDITVRLAEEYRQDLSTLNDLTVMGEEGRQIPLSEIAQWTVDEGFGGIKRIDQDRVVTVMADVRSNFNSNAVLQEAQQLLEPYLQELPSNIQTRWTGQQQEQNEAQDFLTTAFMIALGLMAFILISQFNSISKPFIVMTSVIMSIAGVLYGLLIFQMPFGIIMTGIGVISLAGVVVNNAIVMIDYIDILRARDKMKLYDALVQGGMVRFRPVVLTAITTTLGLIPLAIGFNLDFITLANDPVEFYTNLGEYLYWGGEQAAWWSPMAIAVICGLLFATFLTLIVVPVLYYMIEEARRGTNRFMFGTVNPAIIIDQSEMIHQNGEKKSKPKEEEPVP
ncbi:efflux RND transporter permease subunit [Rhodohalobacter mucosus]|uniref:Copper transporter n=1 Tax=Rhodohalobacter mucosus TaxID=2079485 RepID=A0A316TY49_9BACT|nr:efflux RND transporter permease subunit [Rhodohalobacter mucosus]PWN07712.1 copper transporter [Rhodohalobacter mucosus]